MIINEKARKGRILCTPESREERDWLLCNCMNAHKSSGASSWSIEDCLVNRISLGLEYNIPSPDGAMLQPGARAQLFDYQLNDLQKMLGLSSVLNANRMGYGKTVEALVWAQSLNAQKILILCPKSSRYQWANMVRKWYPDVAEDMWVSPKNCNVLKLPKKVVIITNYEQLLNAHLLEDLKGIRWDVIIADECHRIRNHRAKTSIALKSIPSKYRVGLTGTPIMDRPDDLFSIFQFLNPYYFGSSYHGFTQMFCHIEQTFWGVKVAGLTRNEKRKELLEKVLNMLTVRNPPNMVGNGITESDVVLEMYPKQKKLYKDVKKLAVEELDKEGISIANGMSQVIKLQQLTSNPKLFGIDNNIKFEWIYDLLQDNDSLKILVFSRFRQTIEALNEYLGEHMQVATIHGKITDREAEKQKFITNPRCRVMTGTIGALSESVDGMQEVCNTVIFIDKTWNPEENNQAIGRVYRSGQQHRVDVYTLVCEGTVDEKVGKANLAKLQDIKEVLK